MRPTISFVVAACAALAAGCAPEPESPTATAAAPPPASTEGRSHHDRARRLHSRRHRVRRSERPLSHGLARRRHDLRDRASTAASCRSFATRISSRPSASKPTSRAIDCSSTNSDRAAFAGEPAGQAKLGVYNLTTGERLAMVDLGAVLGRRHAEVFRERRDRRRRRQRLRDGHDERRRLSRDAATTKRRCCTASRICREGAQLNGIVHHDGGYLLVVAGEHTYKVPVANPAGTTKVNVAEPVAGQDGIVLGRRRPARRDEQQRRLSRSSSRSAATTTGRRRSAPVSPCSPVKRRRRRPSATRCGPCIRTSPTRSGRRSSRPSSIEAIAARVATARGRSA